MKKRYLEIDFELMNISSADIITTSGTSGGSGALDGDEDDGGWTEPVHPN